MLKMRHVGSKDRIHKYKDSRRHPKISPFYRHKTKTLLQNVNEPVTVFNIITQKISAQSKYS